MWIALFSQTGTEIVMLSQQLGYWPDVILSNKKNETSTHPALTNRVWYIPHNEIEQLLLEHSEANITLHGYLRILSPEVCESNNLILNSHPGDIKKYPELKGKDPQQRAIDLKLKSTGVVIHQVSSEVDSGEQLLLVKHKIKKNTTVEQLVYELREISIQAWVKVLNEIRN